MEDRLLSSADVAHLLGVSPSSVKRWADSGLLPCVKTPGKHRRFARDEVERFLREHRAEAAALDPEVGVEGWIDLLLRDATPLAVESALLAERARRGAWWRVAEALGPVLRELGDRWAAGGLTVLDEHAASERLERGLVRCCEQLAVDPGAPRVLLVLAEGEEHALGLRLVELVAREAGWGVRWAGRRSPRDEVLRLAESGAVEAVAVSASAASRDASGLEAEARELAAACAETGVLLVLGGRGAWPDELSGAHRLADFEQLRRLLEERRPGI